MNRFSIKDLTLAQLRTLEIPEERVYVVDEGKQGIWERDLSDTTSTDNTGTTIVNSQEPYRWKRRFEGPVVSSWFNLAGDGITDDTTAIQALIQAATSLNLGVVLDKKTYAISGGIDITCSELIGNQTVFTLLDSADNWMFNIKSTKVLLKGITFDGNKANQTAPTYVESYLGYAQKSLIQSFTFFEECIIDSCIFMNSAWGCIAFMDKTDASVLAAYPNIGVDYPESVNTIDKIIIRNCEFNNPNTEGIRAFNYTSVPSFDGITILEFGDLSIEKCKFVSCGSFGFLASGNREHADTIVAGSWNSVNVLNNKFTSSARFDIKIAATTDVFCKDNNSKDAIWGHFQYVEESLDATAYLRGDIFIENSTYYYNVGQDSPLRSNVGFFVQFRGSAIQSGILTTAHKNVVIRGCIVSYPDANNTEVNDCVQFTSTGKYVNALIENNTFLYPRRGAINIGSLVLDETYQPESLTIRNNTYKLGVVQTTASSFVYFSGTGDKIKTVLIQGNDVRIGNYSIYSESPSSCDNLYIIGNNLLGVSNSSVRFTVAHTFDLVNIRNNYFGGNSVFISPTVTTLLVHSNSYARALDLSNSTWSTVQGTVA